MALVRIAFAGVSYAGFIATEFARVDRRRFDLFAVPHCDITFVSSVSDSYLHALTLETSDGVLRFHFAAAESDEKNLISTSSPRSTLMKSVLWMPSRRSF